MPDTKFLSTATFRQDLTSGLVVFLVALPLCLGVALVSNTSPFSGLLAGIVGGIVVGFLSRSHTSVSGPSPGVAAVVAAQIATLESFESFLLAVVLAGVFQIALGCARAGSLAAFFPSSVIKGLLAAIGVILIMKQIPHVVGHDSDPEGDFAFLQPDQENTFSEIGALFNDLHPGAAVIGLLSVALLLVWEWYTPLKKTKLPAPLVVVLFGIGMHLIFEKLGGQWVIGSSHLIKVPVASNPGEFWGFLKMPDFTQLTNPAIYVSAVTIGVVVSLESLLNLEAVDKIDPKQRTSPPSRELVAQGVGNIVSGLMGGLPVSSVIVRSSVNINAGAQTKLSAIVHGFFLLICVTLLPVCLNIIPLSCLAAILFVTGLKLASPVLIKQMWSEGRYQFIPFVATVVSIVLTDLMVGIVIGLIISISFILRSNLRRPLIQFMEKHLGGDVMHIELANQVSFLNKPVLHEALDAIPRGGHVLLDARNCVYMDPDVLSFIRDYKEQTAPARGVEVSMLGFQQKYHMEDEIRYVDYSNRELQERLTPTEVLEVFKDGNKRFQTGRRLTRDLGRQVNATSLGQYPLAVVLSCIDSRTPIELLFDLGLGDIFSVRIAGNITSEKVLGSIEYSCAVAGAKLILVMGHTRCGAVTAAVKFACSHESVAIATGCQHLSRVVGDIQKSIDLDSCRRFPEMNEETRYSYVDAVACTNVLTSIQNMMENSETIRKLVRDGRVGIMGAMYNVATGEVTYLE